MQAIRPLWEQMPLQLNRSDTVGRTSGGIESPFGQMFRAALDAEDNAPFRPVTDLLDSVVEAVRETDAERVQMEYLMATGQLDNPALLNIAATKAQLSVELLVQLRNKAIDAYNELMRISL